MSPEEELLKAHWGYSSLFEAQKKAVAALKQNRDTLVLLPTGGGKSLCYQLPALLRGGLCLVVSPLISLMRDQVDDLRKRGIGAAYKEGTETRGDAEGERKFLYVSPERFDHPRFQEEIRQHRISLVAIDEAHCLSQWGHDFRPAYRKLGERRKEPFWKSVPFMALTASATPETEADIVEQLSLVHPQRIHTSFERTNLFYQVQYTEEKDEDLMDFLHGRSQTGIIYTGSRKKTETLCQQLRSQGIPAMAYHAGMPLRERSQNQQRWKEEPGQVMVSTSAFGMGIDLPDVRYVIHYDFPSSLEQYYQETGRAGRDGQAARALLLYSPEEIPHFRSLQEARIPPIPYLRALYQSVCDYFQIPIGTSPDRLFPFDLEEFCRRFSHSPLRAWHGLQFLEREGYWTLIDSPHTLPRIRILPHPPLDASFQQSEPEVWALLQSLWRWRGDLYERAAPLSFSQWSLKEGIPASRWQRRIERAVALGLVRWYPSLRGMALHFHSLRVDSEQIQIPYSHWKTIRDIHRGKAEKLLEYLDHPGQCRVQFLLNYFGEEKRAPCGHCDLCSPV